MFMMLLWALFLVALLVGAVLLIRYLWYRGEEGASGPSASRDSVDVLKERYARGDIDRDEFEERRRTLGS